MHMYDEDNEESDADPRRGKQGGDNEAFWKRLGVELLQAGLLSSVAVVVGELIRRVDPRRRYGYDQYNGY